MHWTLRTLAGWGGATEGDPRSWTTGQTAIIGAFLLAPERAAAVLWSPEEKRVLAELGVCAGEAFGMSAYCVPGALQPTERVHWVGPGALALSGDHQGQK